MSKAIRCLTTDATVMALAIDTTDIVAEAEDTLDRLKKLREDLDILSEELEDTVWALAM